MTEVYPRASRQELRRRLGTLGVLVFLPLALTGCAWLAQHQGPLMLAGAILAMLSLVVAWAMCGAGPGACVAVSGFAFMLFVGPAMGDYLLNHRGVRHGAVIGDVSTYWKKHGDGRACTVVTTDTDKSDAYEVDDPDGCEGDLREGQDVTLVVDPEGWLKPRLSSRVNGVAPYLVWTSAGLLTATEGFVLYGRLRRRGLRA
ncbi:MULTISPECIES: hypothetical protein [Streptomyces]|uniref:Lipoprotein n=1 Tax=Streptomyces chartreusis NRRL 3882 TaxID=1079985 RepID=A0A2N9B981_STRCX|nr:MULTISPECIES: hypothetical protein [Streptomyces]MYS93427.1 hypothetical protein [Streptomyces sp. SID5464]SOR79904.1 hypothetical protein SCNRRL3882_3363 [Streptomyces chartreusis NRRL 3882]